VQVKWLIEDFEEGNRYHVLSKEVEKQGMECSLITHTPFQSGNYNHYNDRDCVVVQTSLQLARQLIKDKPEWVPNAWLNLKEYECTYYYSMLGKYLFNDDYVMLPRAEVPRLIDKIYKRFGVEGNVYMRPSSGFKTFTGKVFDQNFFDKDWVWVEEFTEPQDIVVISTPKNIVSEWRVVIADSKPIAWSQYKDNNLSVRRKIISDDALNLAKTVASKSGYCPDPMYTMDICKASDGRCYLLEVGSFSCAGLYMCDLEKIVQVASKIALREYKETYNAS